MSNLENAILYYIREFPKVLGRTKLIKALYLLDCEWYKLFGVTFTGLEYKRDYNGPFDSSFYTATAVLESKHLIVERPYFYPRGQGYEFHFTGDRDKEIEIHPIAESICRQIVDMLKEGELDDFLKLAYSTPPMESILAKETTTRKSYGEALPMEELRKSPEPLFTLDEVKEALKNLDMTNRGSDEEYNEVVFSEYVSLANTRERVRDAWQEIGEK